MSAMQASLARVLALAWNGCRQAVRDKVLYVLAGFGALLIFASVIISQLTVGERARIVMDLGLSGTSLLSVLTAVFVSINQLGRERDRRTIDTILAKPVSRWEYLLGKFLGLGLTLAFMILAMGVLHSIVLAFVGGFNAAAWTAMFLGFIEALLVAAIALFFSTFTTTVPSMFITLAFIVIGHTSWGLLLMAERMSGGFTAGLLRFLYWSLPNLDAMNVRAEVVWGQAISGSVVFFATAYGLFYSAFLIVLGALILSRRDLA